MRYDSGVDSDFTGMDDGLSAFEKARPRRTERAAYVLREAFNYPYKEIAE